MPTAIANQSALRIVVATHRNLETAASAEIRYSKADGTTGAFPAVVLDPEGGTIAHEFAAGELDLAGWWTFWAAVTFADGRTAAGEAARGFVRAEGSGAVAGT